MKTEIEIESEGSIQRKRTQNKIATDELLRTIRTACHGAIVDEYALVCQASYILQTRAKHLRPQAQRAMRIERLREAAAD